MVEAKVEKVEGRQISVVIPALNEAPNIGPLLERLWGTMRALNLVAEIIVVDGGSADQTWEVAENLGAKCMLQRRLGYAGALREGFQAAQGQYVLTLDSDLSHPPELFGALWAARDEAHIIIASRFTKGGASDAPFMRHLLSAVLNKVFSFLLSIPVQDMSSGYRLYRREALNLGDHRQENFSILQEVLVRAYSHGYSIKEIPLHYEERASGTSHVSFVKFALSYLPTLYRLWKLRNWVTTADYEYRSYSSRHPLQRHWIRRRLKLIKDLLRGAERVLDVGSGSNYLAATTPGFVALDIEPCKIRFLTHLQVEAKHGDAQDLPFEDGSFDGVVLSQVLPYVVDVNAVIKEAYRVLQGGGSLVVVVPDSRRLSWRVVGSLYRLLPNVRAAQVRIRHRFTRAGLIERLANSGFRSIKYEYVCGAELVLLCRKVG
jgi:dolichol-phosphate mannosyltransferase